MAVETNKTKWTDSFAKSIGVTTNPTGGEGGNEQPTDKYDALEYTSYKDMLSSKIQASVARDQAQKYVGNSLANAGFEGQGIAESTRAGITGSYGKAIMNADQTHQANLIDIESQRQEGKEEDWQSVMTMLQQAQSQDDLDYLKSEFYDGMNDKQKKMFDYYYSSYSQAISPTTINSYDALRNTTYVKSDGNVSLLSEHFNEETKVLWHHGSTGDYQNGDVIKVTNGEGDTIYMKWVGNGFATTNESEYNNASSNNVNSYELKRMPGKKNSYTQTNTKK